MEALDAVPYLDNLTDVFMSRGKPYRNRVLCPVIPLVNMYICSTDSCLVNLNLNIIWTYFRNRNPLHPQTFFRLFFHECPHHSVIFNISHVYNLPILLPPSPDGYFRINYIIHFIHIQ